ncbi:hypothetical protein V496_03027 [Pseudogymnoascus sp. VKM F-4515 (FW-2607)]|nr:hypothetical protein V496_03027 [Pseudogymnoascus sp. VKM F-4515 (FW-2607)]KFY91078.1 hypothetical protein V498_05667 [Pseudogymnoascus sp. VKM F-4517 (FW-2822)]
MAPPSTPPPIPERTRYEGKYEGRRGSLPPPSLKLRAADGNRVHVHPASPEVISSLITSLSIISSPANRLFELPGVAHSLPNSPYATQTTFDPIDRLLQNESSQGGSFGIDYGAYNQSSHNYAMNELPLDEMSATAPVIRTAKPPSGYSSLTAPKSPKPDGTPIKNLLRSSRPTSRESSGDDALSIGSVSIEPGSVTRDLRRRRSSDSWDKKQGRHNKGLLYMSSKERMRESERKRSSSSTTRGSGVERLPKQEFDTKSFMSEAPITEEPVVEQPEYLWDDSAAPSPSIGPDSSMNGAGNGGIGSGRYIPTRDSSLRNKKRAPHSGRSSRQPAPELADDTIKEVDEHSSPLIDKGAEKFDQSQSSLAVQKPREQSAVPSPTPQKPRTGGEPDRNLYADQANGQSIKDDGAPSPNVTQRTSRDKSEQTQSKVKKSSGRQTPDPFERLAGRRDSKRDSGKAKRSSGYQSGAEGDNEQNHRISSTPSKKDIQAAEGKANRTSTDARPTSADSIDDAVDAYLCSPRLSHKIKHPQTGRVISFSEVGDPEGFAVFCCVGMGLTRYITAFYDELALTLKLRLITPDRPGVGDSEPYTDGTATPLSWPDDVYSICQTLKITKFSILAHSAGAIYALATALRMPQHIRGRIHLLAPWIPPSQLNVFGGQQVMPPANSIPTSQRILRALPTPILKAANSSFMSATSSSITSSLPKQKRNKRKSTTAKDAPTIIRPNVVAVGPADKENVGPHSDKYGPVKSGQAPPLPRAANNPPDLSSEAAILAAAAMSASSKERQTTYDTRLTHAIWDLATSGANPAVDLLVCLERRHTIGFRYVDITRAVVIHHGSKDTRVPVENVKWLGKMMRRCEVRILEGEGHGLMASAQVMGGVLMEIAGEWDDWMKVVERKGGNKGEEAGRRLRESRSVSAFR